MRTIKIEKHTENLFKIIIWSLALFWLFVTLYPLFVMVINSLKTRSEYMISTMWALPKKATLNNYLVVLESGFMRSYFNSFIVTFFSLVFMISFSTLAAYGLSKLKFPGSKTVYAIFIAGMMIPIHITIIPIFKLTQSLHLYDSLAGLVGPYVASALPMAIFILKGFIDAVPGELNEAAEIDGADKFVTFRLIILPVLTPAISTVMIYNAVYYWGEFLYALVLTMSKSNRTINLGLWAFYGERGVDLTLIFSALAICSIPLIIVYAIFQERVINGMVAGAVKG